MSQGKRSILGIPIPKLTPSDTNPGAFNFLKEGKQTPDQTILNKMKGSLKAVMTPKDEGGWAEESPSGIYPKVPEEYFPSTSLNPEAITLEDIMFQLKALQDIVLSQGKLINEMHNFMKGQQTVSVAYPSMAAPSTVRRVPRMPSHDHM